MAPFLRMLLENSVYSAMATVIVLTARLLLRKAPRSFSYVLWAAVFFRLACPVPLYTGIGVIPELSAIQSVFTLREYHPLPPSGSPGTALPANDGAPQEMPSPPQDTITLPQTAGSTGAYTAKTDSAPHAFSVSAILFAVWAAGASALVILYAASWLRLKKRVAAAVRVGGKDSIIYESDRIDTAFVRGIVHPRIYVPLAVSQPPEGKSELSGSYRMILRHEQVHIRRGDNIIKPLALTVTCVYWFSPAAWLSYHLMCRDMEMSCDEAVLRDFGDKHKGGYCKMLLDFGTNKRFTAGTAFGESSAERRIKHLLFTKRPTVPAMIAAAALVVLSMTACVGTAGTAPDYTPTVSGTNVSSADANTQYTEDTQVTEDTQRTENTQITENTQSTENTQNETDLSGVVFPDLLASYSTDYNEANVARASNLCLAADYIEGSVIMPGEVFSFNKYVGEWTPERGFSKATIYPAETFDGSFDGGYGGGVSQAASTLFYCAVKADLETVERTPHRYAVPYMIDDMGAVMYGSDAAVSNERGGEKIDMSFRNTKEHPIIIRTAHDKGVLTFEIWGTWDGYTAEYRFAELETKLYSVILRQYTAGKRERPGAAGRTMRTYRVVFYQEKQGVGERMEHERYLESVNTYEPLDRIVYVDTLPDGLEYDVPYSSSDVAYLFPPQG